MIGEHSSAPRGQRAGSLPSLACEGAAALVLTLACAHPAPASVAPSEEGRPFAPCVEEPNQGLLGEWEGVETNSGDGSPTTPLVGVVVAFSPGGYVGWDDGCNQHAGSYARQGNQVAIREEEATEAACAGASVELTHVREWRVVGSDLELVSPRERHLFRRSPYSVLTRRPWSLFSITELATGETHKVDPYRQSYEQLVLHTEADRQFTFTDFDLAQWSGSIRVGPATHAVELAWDMRSANALDTKRRMANDATAGRASGRYPIGVAAELDWAQVDAFCLVEHDSIFGPSVMLELRGDKYVYTLSPR